MNGNEKVMKVIEELQGGLEMTYNEARLKYRCPYRQDLEILCFEDCGRGNAADCPIWLKESGLLAQAIGGD